MLINIRRETTARVTIMVPKTLDEWIKSFLWLCEWSNMTDVNKNLLSGIEYWNLWNSLNRNQVKCLMNYSVPNIMFYGVNMYNFTVYDCVTIVSLLSNWFITKFKCNSTLANSFTPCWIQPDKVVLKERQFETFEFGQSKFAHWQIKWGRIHVFPSILYYLR